MICYCIWCSPGWRNSKRNAKIEILRIDDPEYHFGPVVFFNRRGVRQP